MPPARGATRQAASARHAKRLRPDADRNSVGRAAVRAGNRGARAGYGRNRTRLPPRQHPHDRHRHRHAGHRNRGIAARGAGPSRAGRTVARLGGRVAALEGARRTRRKRCGERRTDRSDHLARQLRVLHRDVRPSSTISHSSSGSLEHDGNALDADARKWQERLSFLENRRVPAPLLERARSIEAEAASRECSRPRIPRRRAARARPCAGVCWRASTTRAHSLRRRRSASVRKGRSWNDLPCGRLGAAPAQIELVAAELRAAWRLLRSYVAREERTGRIVLRRPGADGWLFTGDRGRTPARRSAPTADRSPHRCSSR